ncbi:MAG: hypothetical protein HOC71_11160 [Candidatus Latescibacteria bacterium]|jgi:hypothetical protein|nr:hypothetical protein [Candidatus Latescibacterota bacterium]
MKSNSFFIFIIIFFMLYGSIMIFQTSLEIDGQRYFVLEDDQMISMTYAKNFANGNGLVWNKTGEKVEGYSNPLWVMYMSLFHFLPVSQSHICLYIQISGLLLLLANLFVVRKLAQLVSYNSGPVSISSVFLTAFYYPLNYWSLHGFEVSTLTLLITLSVLMFIKAKKSHSITLKSFTLLGLGTLLRLDAAIPYIMTLLYLYVSTKKNRVKYLCYYSIPLLFFLAGQTLFRYFYYGEVLPNPYYLKMTGYPLILRLSRGLYVFLNFVKESNSILLLLPLIVLLKKNNKHSKLLLLILAGQISYSIYVGGDAWEWYEICNRFIVIVIPLFFIVFSLSVHEISTFIKQVISTGSKPININKYYISFLILSLFSFNSMVLAEWFLLKPPFEKIEQTAQLELGLYIEKITSPEARIAVVWAGTMPYFVGRNYIDILGKNDKIIAHEKMKTFEPSQLLFPHNNISGSKYTFFYPGPVISG